MKPKTKLLSKLLRDETTRQEVINSTFLTIKTALNSKKASGDDLMDALVTHLGDKLNISSFSLEELYNYKEDIEKIDPPAGGDADAYNTVAFLAALHYLVTEQIKIKLAEKMNREEIKIEKIINICEDYIKSLAEDIKSDAQHLKVLTANKCNIVNNALNHLKDPNFNYEDKIAHFQNELKHPENLRILRKHRDKYKHHWAKEALMQVGTLFFINVYRLLVGADGANLINKSEHIIKQAEIKNQIRDNRSQEEKNENKFSNQ